MAKKNKSPPGETTETVTATVKSRQSQGRWRCGMFFPVGGATVQVTPQQLERIKDDPVLTVLETGGVHT